MPSTGLWRELLSVDPRLHFIPWASGRVDTALQKHGMTREPQPEILKRAEQLGTLHAIDRSKQYEQAKYPDLLRAVNEAWSKIRSCEKSITQRDQAIETLKKRVSHYRIINIALTSIITGLAWEGVKALTHIFLK